MTVKSAKIFLIGMYIHLLLSIAVPVSVVFAIDGALNNIELMSLIIFFMAEVAAVHTIGWIAAVSALVAYKQGKTEQLRKGWKLLKLGSIPFYILNFIYSFLAWVALIGGTRGFMILFVPVPIAVTCLMIAQSGCVGACYIKYLRGQPENNGRPHWIHYAMQFISVLDIISTFIILKSKKIMKTV